MFSGSSKLQMTHHLLLHLYIPEALSSAISSRYLTSVFRIVWLYLNASLHGDGNAADNFGDFNV